MSPGRSFQAVLSRLFVFAFVLSLLGVHPAAGQAPASPTVLDKFVYLPLTVRAGEISGTVTHNGVLAGGVPLKLYLYNGAGWSSIASTTTAGDGRYRFAGVPSLLPGQRYGVEYFNPNDANTYDGRLSFWDTRELTSYDSKVGAHIGDFDVADTDLVSPLGGTFVPLSYTWVKRASSPTDNYYMALFDLDYDNPFFVTSGLGWVDSYQMNNLPGGFGTYYWYGWNVRTSAPDGGFGYSFWYHEVYFASSQASGAASAVSVVKVPSAQLLMPYAHRPLRDLAAEAPGQ